ncbi:lacto-N-biosidase chaperone LnbY [Bifidobacterium samirii]|uniref:Peptidylprolyl isomerase n=1 Tax=Bifidobacterium samirii TaxID=2306974 RepID=A0A430FWS0_9BIFI|nr:hypothetical protein [Bifidobacterium samirii]RSX58744.1 peptidylprolyl isomerase [Bifidobacterium samirii]
MTAMRRPSSGRGGDGLPRMPHGRDRARPPHHRRLRTALAAAMAGLLVGALVGCTSPAADSGDDHVDTVDFPTITFNETAVTEREYTQAMRTQRTAAVSHFSRTYGVTLGTDPEQWTADHDGGNACEWLAHRVIDALLDRHAAYRIAARAGLVDDDSYEGVEARMKAANEANARTKRDGDIVYGRSSYDIGSWLDYEATALRNAYTADESNPGMALGDDEVQAYYDAHDWTVDGVDGKAPLDKVRGNVKAQMRAERYTAIVADEAAAIDADVPWDELVGYTLDRI